MMQITTLGQAAKDEHELGNSLGDVGNKKKKILERQLATEESSKYNSTITPNHE